MTTDPAAILAVISELATNNARLQHDLQQVVAERDMLLRQLADEHPSQPAT